jgi:hypothetical protein
MKNTNLTSRSQPLSDSIPFSKKKITYIHLILIEKITYIYLILIEKITPPKETVARVIEYWKFRKQIGSAKSNKG